jgi:hypothetical protein
MEIEFLANGGYRPLPKGNLRLFSELVVNETFVNVYKRFYTARKNYCLNFTSGEGWT